MNYAWVKCSERMPPEGEAVIVRRAGYPLSWCTWTGQEWTCTHDTLAYGVGFAEWLDPGGSELDRLAALVEADDKYVSRMDLFMDGSNQWIVKLFERGDHHGEPWLHVPRAIAHLEAQRPVTKDDLRQAWQDYFSVVDVTADFVGSHFGDVLNRYLEQEDDA